jgi:hypothetical protein
MSRECPQITTQRKQKVQVKRRIRGTSLRETNFHTERQKVMRIIIFLFLLLFFFPVAELSPLLTAWSDDRVADFLSDRERESEMGKEEEMKREGRG